MQIPLPPDGVPWNIAASVVASGIVSAMKHGRGWFRNRAQTLPPEAEKTRRTALAASAETILATGLRQVRQDSPEWTALKAAIEEELGEAGALLGDMLFVKGPGRGHPLNASKWLSHGDVDPAEYARIVECLLTAAEWAVANDQILAHHLGLEGINEVKARVKDLPGAEEIGDIVEDRVRAILKELGPLGPKAPTTAHHFPSPNPNFTGREKQLESLRASLEEGGTTALTQAITGLGGVGKTQLAIEYAHRHRDDYDVVWWVRSEEPSQLAEDFGRLAKRLRLCEEGETDQGVLREKALGWLESNGGWLLVFDNAPDANALKDYHPGGGRGHVIITSRDPDLSLIHI